jgi:shikimate kinase
LGDKTNIRPLMPTRESFLMLMNERRGHYSGFTKKVMVDGKSPEEIVDEIRSRFNI